MRQLPDFAESSGAVVYSNSVNNYNNCLPGGGVLPAGTYSVTMLDSYGDGSNGGYLDVQIQDIGGAGEKTLTDSTFRNQEAPGHLMDLLLTWLTLQLHL